MELLSYLDHFLSKTCLQFFLHLNLKLLVIFQSLKQNLIVNTWLKFLHFIEIKLKIKNNTPRIFILYIGIISNWNSFKLTESVGFIGSITHQCLLHLFTCCLCIKNVSYYYGHEVVVVPLCLIVMWYVLFFLLLFSACICTSVFSWFFGGCGGGGDFL